MLNKYWMNIRIKILSPPFLWILLIQEACPDLPMSPTCWAPAGVTGSPTVAVVPALWVPAGWAHACLRGPAHRRPIAPSPRSRGRFRTWREKHALNGERAAEGWERRIEGLLSPNRRLSQQNLPVFWPGPLLSSVSPGERERNNGVSLFYSLWRALT